MKHNFKRNKENLEKIAPAYKNTSKLTEHQLDEKIAIIDILELDKKMYTAHLQIQV